MAHPDVVKHQPLWPYLLAGLALAGASVFAVARADKPPFLEMEASRRAITSSIELQAEEYAPEYIKAAQDSVQAASREIDHQIRRFFVIRDYDLARTRLAHATRITREAVTATAARRDSIRSLALDRIEEARKALDQSRKSMQYVQFDGYSRSRLVMLEISRQEALKAASDGKYRTAEQKARSVINGAATIQEAVDQKLGDYQQSSRLWNLWATETINWSRKNRAYAILVRKLDHRCDVFYAGQLKTSFTAELGIRWMGHKMRTGDHATPEGRYHIIAKKAASRYYKALEINYPNEDDRRRFQLAKRNGNLNRSAGIGGLIEIHGNGGRGSDWTMGCVALRNGDMDALFSMVGVGTPVTIVGDWDGTTSSSGAAR
jgi:lipoprotein-anchoring transpeptidase ErfK/SrfK